MMNPLSKLKNVFIEEPVSRSIDDAYAYISERVDKHMPPFEILDYVGYTEECQPLSDDMLLVNNHLNITISTEKQLAFLDWYYRFSGINIKQGRTYNIGSQKILDYLVDRKLELKRVDRGDLPNMTPYQVLYYMVPTTYYSSIGDFIGKSLIFNYFNELSEIDKINFQLAVIGFYYDEISIVC